MAQLWGGRFTKETDQLVYNFNASISFDKKLYAQDIRGSIAHVMMLAKQEILTEAEKQQIIEGLEGILDDVEKGKLEITDKYEDIHSFVEANLIDRIGDAGKKLHTGRSRNDQVALDMKLYTRDEIAQIDQLLRTLLRTILENHAGEYGDISCLDLHICRRHSRSHLHIIWAHTLRCLREITNVCVISSKRMNYLPAGIRSSCRYHLSAGS